MRLIQSLRNFWAGNSRTQKIVTVLLLALWVVLLIHLFRGDKPWDNSIVERIEAAQEAGKRWRMKDYIAVGLWYASLVNLGLTTVLLATVRLWTKPLDLPPAQKDRISPHPRVGLSFLGLVVAAMALTAGLGLPRLSLSLWGDEEHALRQVILGYHKRDDAGELIFRPCTLKDNLWMYYGPNNHFLFTLCSRLSLEIWKQRTPDSTLHFSETATRLPSYVAGILAVAATACLLSQLGFRKAGAVAGFFLAIHPWFLRYATEARGYAFVLLFIPLGLLCLLAAFRSGKWIWWLLYALCGFCVVYSYPAAVYILVTQNIAVLIAIPSVFGLSRAAFVQCSRWFTANVLATMLAIQLLLPTVPQMAFWLARDRAKATLGVNWIQDFWGYLSTGMAWHPWAYDNPLCHVVRDFAVTQPVSFWIILILLPLLALIGFVRICLGGTLHFLLALALLLAAPLGFVHAQSNGNILYAWYLIYALPAFVMFVALGLETLSLLLKPFRLPQVAALAGITIVFLGWYWSITGDQRRALQTASLEPQRESVLATRPSLDITDPANAGIITVQFVFTTPAYDMLAIEIDTADELRELMKQAEEQGKPLYVNFGSEGWARHAFPELMALVDDPELFVRSGTFYGMDQPLTRLVYRYRKTHQTRAGG